MACHDYFLLVVFVGSGTESDSDDSVPELEEQDSAQTQTQQAQVRVQPCLASCSLLSWTGTDNIHCLCKPADVVPFTLLWWLTQWLSFFWIYWSQPFCPEKRRALHFCIGSYLNWAPMLWFIIMHCHEMRMHTLSLTACSSCWNRWGTRQQSQTEPQWKEGTKGNDLCFFVTGTYAIFCNGQIWPLSNWLVLLAGNVKAWSQAGNGGHQGHHS